MALPRGTPPPVAPPKVAATCKLADVRVAEDKNIEERLSDDLALDLRAARQLHAWSKLHLDDRILKQLREKAVGKLEEGWEQIKALAKEGTTHLAYQRLDESDWMQGTMAGLGAVVLPTADEVFRAFARTGRVGYHHKGLVNSSYVSEMTGGSVSVTFDPAAFTGIQVLTLETGLSAGAVKGSRTMLILERQFERFPTSAAEHPEAGQRNDRPIALLTLVGGDKEVSLDLTFEGGMKAPLPDKIPLGSDALVFEASFKAVLAVKAGIKGRWVTLMARRQRYFAPSEEGELRREFWAVMNLAHGKSESEALIKNEAIRALNNTKALAQRLGVDSAAIKLPTKTNDSSADFSAAFRALAVKLFPKELRDSEWLRADEHRWVGANPLEVKHPQELEEFWRAWRQVDAYRECLSSETKDWEEHYSFLTMFGMTGGLNVGVQLAAEMALKAEKGNDMKDLQKDLQKKTLDRFRPEDDNRDKKDNQDKKTGDDKTGGDKKGDDKMGKQGDKDDEGEEEEDDSKAEKTGGVKLLSVGGKAGLELVNRETQYSVIRYQTTNSEHPIGGLGDLPGIKTQDTRISYNQAVVAPATTSPEERGRIRRIKQFFRDRAKGSAEAKIIETELASREWTGAEIIRGISYSSSTVYWTRPEVLSEEEAKQARLERLYLKTKRVADAFSLIPLPNLPIKARSVPVEARLGSGYAYGQSASLRGLGDLFMHRRAVNAILTAPLANEQKIAAMKATSAGDAKAARAPIAQSSMAAAAKEAALQAIDHCGGKAIPAYRDLLCASLGINLIDLGDFLRELEAAEVLPKLISDNPDFSDGALLIEATFARRGFLVGAEWVPDDTGFRGHWRLDPQVRDKLLAQHTLATCELQCIRLRYRLQDLIRDERTWTLGFHVPVVGSITAQVKSITEAGSEGIQDLHTTWFGRFKDLEPHERHEQAVPPVVLFCQ